ncbi:hypothetical protein GOP47_0030104 [Adiantum capillus-veneris]|nr:hypothetical protein GOP47_0030104 [Adiantum capillus-veneris]
MARFDLQDFKKQASFFLREKLNDARLALTDVSRMQLLTEEATNEDPWGPETRTMAMLADAAFELEEYERIVQVIHHRLDGGKKRPWRQLYKTLVVLEYLLTHGPKSMGREFRTDICWVEELSQFNFTNQQGIDRGLMVRKKADRVLELINDTDFRNEERCRARKISIGIQGFGSSSPHQGYPEDGVHNREQKYELPAQSRDARAQTLQVDPKWVQYEKCYSMSGRREQDGSCFSLAQDNVIELEDSNVGLLDAVNANDSFSCEDVQGGSISEMFSEGNRSISTAPCEDSHSLFDGIKASALVYTCNSASSFPVLSQAANPKLRMKFQHQWQPTRLTDCNVKFGKAA